MSDLKLFRITDGVATELASSTVSLEKSLQSTVEQNMETLFGVRFLASEHSTGPKHGGRIDSLGLDENSSPVIFEYKRALNENVINQGFSSWTGCSTIAQSSNCWSWSSLAPLTPTPLTGATLG